MQYIYIYPTFESYDGGKHPFKGREMIGSQSRPHIMTDHSVPDITRYQKR